MMFPVQVLPTSEQFDPNAYLGFMHAVRIHDPWEPAIATSRAIHTAGLHSR